MSTTEGREALAETVAEADLVMLTFPLYVDSLPAPVVAALEEVAKERQGGKASTTQLFNAIANSGFPEAHHSATALPSAQPLPGRTVSQDANEGLAKPVLPHSIYRAAGSRRWRKKATKYGARRRMKEKPYAEAGTG